MSASGQPLKAIVPVPLRLIAWAAVLLSARTQAEGVASVLASATARDVMVGPVDMNTADSSGVCGWLMITST